MEQNEDTPCCLYKDMVEQQLDIASQKISHSMRSSIYRYFKRQSQVLVSESNEEITNASLVAHQ